MAQAYSVTYYFIKVFFAIQVSYFYDTLVNVQKLSVNADLPYVP